MLKRVVVLFLLFGSLALGFYLWNQSETALQTYASVTGVYHENRICDSTGSCSSTPSVAFTTRKGSGEKFYPFTVSFMHQDFIAAFYDETNYHEGQHVPVLYNPAHPQQALISSATDLWWDALFWFALGASVLLVVMIRVFRQDTRKSRPPGPPMRR